MVRTRTGGLLTLIITTTVLIYAAYRLEALTLRRNPNMSSYKEDIPVDQVLNFQMQENNSKIAFSVEEYWTKQARIDP